jgi:hypothetical protein
MPSFPLIVNPFDEAARSRSVCAVVVAVSTVVVAVLTFAVHCQSASVAANYLKPAHYLNQALHQALVAGRVVHIRPRP